MVLRRSYAKLRESVQVARSDTLALIDGPVVMVRQGRHRPVLHRQAEEEDRILGELLTEQDFAQTLRGARGLHRDSDHGWRATRRRRRANAERRRVSAGAQTTWGEFSHSSAHLPAVVVRVVI